MKIRNCTPKDISILLLSLLLLWLTCFLISCLYIYKYIYIYIIYYLHINVYQYITIHTCIYYITYICMHVVCMYTRLFADSSCFTLLELARKTQTKWRFQRTRVFKLLLEQGALLNICGYTPLSTESST